MKKAILYAITVLVAIIGAEENCNVPGNPDGSCQQAGYVCNLGFNVMGENNMMFFNLGADASCTNLLKSEKFKTKATPNSVAYTAYSNLTLIENEENMGPLSLTLAGSLAMLAVNNNIPVDIIYKKVDSLYFNGIKLLSIHLLNSTGSTNP
jgi:hypothetical protein